MATPTPLQQIILDRITCTPAETITSASYAKGTVLRGESGVFVSYGTLIDLFSGITVLGDIEDVDTGSEFNRLANTVNGIAVVSIDDLSGITKLNEYGVAIGGVSATAIWQCDGTEWYDRGRLNSVISGTISDIATLENIPSVVGENEIIILTQQVSTDSVAGFTRNYSNQGLAVTMTAGQSGRNVDGFVCAEVEFTKNTSDTIAGVLLNYHHDKLCSVARKGRIFMQSTVAYQRSAHLGQQVQPSTTSGKITPIASGGTGEIVDGGVHPDLGDYVICDLNLP